MNQFCDLHTHSNFSDGTCSPAQLIEEAVNLGLAAVALCDHNTADGLPAFLAAAEGKDIRAIPGAEFSVDYHGTELHLLGLFLDPVHFPAVKKLSDGYLRRKAESNLALVEALRRAGYPLDYDRILAQSPNGNINRSHIAEALVEAGYADSKDTAFEKFVNKGGKYYREPAKPSVWEILDFLTAIGAVPVLAHPFLNLNEAELRGFLPRAKARGLAGMEVAYSTYDDATAACAARLAREFGLLPSGGSDYHGSAKPHIRLGTGKGSLQVPIQWAHDLTPR